MKIDRFTGINNVDRRTHAGPGDFDTAYHVLVTDEGALIRRSGSTLAIDLTQAADGHSLFSHAGYLYYVTGDELVRNDLGQTDEAVLSLDDGTTSFSYLPLNGKVYCGNGTDGCVLLADGSAVPWGTPIPTVPTAADASGLGDPGTYLVSLAYLLSDGQESGATVPVAVEVTNGGIALSGLVDSTDSRAVGTNVYISGPNGEAGPTGEGLFLAAMVPTGTNSVSISDIPPSGQECRTLNLVPMPPGKFTFFHAGRLYTAIGEVLFHSEVWNYELTNAVTGFHAFDGTITAGAGLDNGIWIGTTTDLVYAAGKDPLADGGFQIRSRSNGTCLVGGQVVSQNDISNPALGAGPRALFVLASGVHACDGGGQIVKLTKKFRSEYSDSTGAQTVYSSSDGNSWYFFSLGTNIFAMNMSNFAVTRIMQSSVNSFATFADALQFMRATGVWTYGGDTDDGALITVMLRKSEMSFGTNLIKRLTSAYLHMKSNGSLSFVVSSENNNGTVVLYDNLNYAHGSRVKMPRGVYGRNLTLQIVNNDGSDFEIYEMDIITEIFAKHARQTVPGN